ncbi:MAG: hypothetical protein WCV71_03995 [Patescibacteria group bacterium]
MKLFKNQKGFNDTIVVAILGGIIGAIFITGVFVWQEIDKQKELNSLIKQIVHVSNSNETSIVQGNDGTLEEESLKPEEVFGEMMIAAKNVDVDKYFSYVYSSASFLKAAKEMAALYPDIKELSLENTLVSQFNNLEYTIDNVEIKDDIAVLKVNIVKNNRQKKPQYFNLIKDKGEWKINSYGWMHPADGIVENLDACREICDSSPMFVENTNECFCFREKPSVVDLSYLEVERCENQEIPFRSTCYISYAKETLNEEYCKKTSLMNMNDCFSTLALIKDDDAICDYLLDDEQCLNGVANN